MEKCNLDLLLVEDDHAQAELFLHAMGDTSSKLVIQHADSVERALEVLHACDGHSAPRLILLDLHLPPRNGLEVLSAVRKHDNPRVRFTPVIMFSSSGDERDIWNAYQAGATCYLEKPGDWDTTRKLVALIEAFWCAVRLPKQPT